MVIYGYISTKISYIMVLSPLRYHKLLSRNSRNSFSTPLYLFLYSFT